MSDIVISAEGIGKLYKLGARERYRTLRDSVAGFFNDPVGRFRSARNRDGEVCTFWALRDVSFTIRQGEVVGIIGRNGAGKSTLLKILSRITEPSEGLAKMQGRVGSLLEVGTGFHPELTGRENIFLNGAILGMRRAEIARKFDEIVDFAEVEKFIDTPVKHYSSGMYVRLAFAVAAHLEPEIMIVDEVLAVGDVTFQRKCLGKMGDVAKQGRTVLLVTHNMLPVRTLCTRAILLGDGRVIKDTLDVREAISLYSGLKISNETEWRRGVIFNGPDSPLVFTRLQQTLTGDQPHLRLQITAEMTSLRPHAPAFIAVDILDSTATPIIQAIPTQIPFIEFTDAPREVVVTVDLPPLIPGTYQVTVWAGPHYSTTFDQVEMALTFIVIDSPQSGRSHPHTVDHGHVVPESSVLVRPLREAEQIPGTMSIVRLVRERVDFFRGQAAQFGFAGAVKLRLIDKYNKLAGDAGLLPHFLPTIRLHPPGCEFPIYLRTGNSDREVLRQIFIEREYEPLNPPESVEYIIDCGANVGYSSVYFLNRYPRARVVAVEPDPDNAAICRKNLAPYGDRAELIVGAVWSHPATLTLVRGAYRDGQAWTTQVRPINPERDRADGGLNAFDIPALILRLGCTRVDILKMDIERSEAVVFRDPAHWLGRIRNIAIELHDTECEEIFFSAMQQCRFDLKRSGELTICRDISVSGVRLAIGK